MKNEKKDLLKIQEDVVRLGCKDIGLSTQVYYSSILELRKQNPTISEENFEILARLEMLLAYNQETVTKYAKDESFLKFYSATRLDMEKENREKIA